LRSDRGRGGQMDSIAKKKKKGRGRDVELAILHRGVSTLKERRVEGKGSN